MKQANEHIKSLLEQLVIKMLENDLNETLSTKSHLTGTTVTNFRQNDSLYLLLYYLLNDNDEELPATKKNNETKDLLQKIEELQTKNRHLYEDITKYLDQFN